MAAVQTHCAHCGRLFDRRAVTVQYCKQPACQQARERDRKRAWRKSTRARIETVWAFRRDLGAGA